MINIKPQEYKNGMSMKEIKMSLEKELSCAEQALQQGNIIGIDKKGSFDYLLNACRIIEDAMKKIYIKCSGELNEYIRKYERLARQHDAALKTRPLK